MRRLPAEQLPATLQVQETLPDEILAKMHAAPKPDVPTMDPHDLPNADGLMFGFPTRSANASWAVMCDSDLKKLCTSCCSSLCPLLRTALQM